MAVKPYTMAKNATIASELSLIVQGHEYVRRVWSDMRKGVNEVRLCIKSNPKWPDYVMYESMDDPIDPSDETDYGPTIGMRARSGRTHKLLPSDKWNEADDVSDAGVTWHQVRRLYAEITNQVHKL